MRAPEPGVPLSQTVELHEIPAMVVHQDRRWMATAS